MKNLLLATIVLLISLVSCSPYPNKTYKLYTKEYTGFTHNAAIDSIEKEYHVHLNSLEKIEKFGGDLSGKIYREFDSIYRLISSDKKNSEIKKYEYLEKRDFVTDRLDSIIGVRTQEIANIHYKQKTGLILTLGGDGYCGIEGKWYNELTLKYGFKYKTILCSDMLFYEHNMAEFYNYSAKKILDSINGNGWEQKLEDEILKKKRNIKIKTDFISVLRTKEYDIFDKELLIFPKEVTKLRNLEILYVCDNFFSEIDESICNLQKLKSLLLYNNKLQNFPKEILCLNQLEELYLNHNIISRIPIDITKLENLKFLDIRDNLLDDLPNELSKMKNLETLDVTNNKFTKIPEVLYKMKTLKTLRIGIHRSLWATEDLKKQGEELKKALPNTYIY